MMRERIVELGTMEKVWLKVSTLKTYFERDQKASKQLNSL